MKLFILWSILPINIIMACNQSDSNPENSNREFSTDVDTVYGYKIFYNGTYNDFEAYVEKKSNVTYDFFFINVSGEKISCTELKTREPIGRDNKCSITMSDKQPFAEFFNFKRNRVIESIPINKNESQSELIQ